MIKEMFLENDYICNTYVADTFLKRLAGYMFRKKPHYEAIAFTSCKSVHTFFMRFKIDILFVNSDLVVVKKFSSVSPGRVILPIKGTELVIESLDGEFAFIREGHKLSFDNE